MNIMEYEIKPKQSFKIIRNCSGCGTKSLYKNTQKFRVNANGNKLDVWLIYQCEACKHTFNLSIYRGQRPASLPKDEYECFCRNDVELAEQFGRNFQFFKRNKAEVDLNSMDYEFKELTECSFDQDQPCLITIWNSYGLKLRTEKQIAEVLGLSRSQVKQGIDREEITVIHANAQALTFFKHNETETMSDLMLNPA